MQHALPGIVSVQPDTVLVIIGGEARDALHGGSGGESERILRAAMEVGVSTHVRMLGRCEDATLKAAYAAADCHVFPVLDVPGDVEGFGMVALEAAAHGLQTVAFNVGGVPDAVADGISGCLVAAGDYPGMTSAVLAAIEKRLDSRVDDCIAFARSLGWNTFSRRLNEIIDSAQERAPA